MFSKRKFLCHELIISRNTRKISQAVLLVDEVTRCNHDRFIELIRESFCIAGEGYNIDKSEVTIKHVGSVKSSSPENIRLCLCDILLGCILNNVLIHMTDLCRLYSKIHYRRSGAVNCISRLNNNIPTKNKWKNKIRKELVKRLGVNDLLENTWSEQKVSPKISRKFRIWYWKPGNKKAQVTKLHR